MTTYAPNFTPRLRVHYVAWGLHHTIQVRAPRGTGSGPLSDRRGPIHDIFNLWSIKLAEDFAFISAEYALTDSEVFYPLDPPLPVTGTVPATAVTPIQKITSTTFSGKGGDSRARFSLYGIKWVLAKQNTSDMGSDDGSYNGVIESSEMPLIGNTVDAATTQFYATSGASTFWYRRATVKPNDFLLRLVRRGTIS
jgi:hypothetical protein